MIRTQVQLTEEQYAMLKKLSHDSHESIAALIRRSVDQLLLTRKPDRAALYRQAAMVAGRYTADAQDVSINHDKYLDEVYG
jgi:hypothetical protein